MFNSGQNIHHSKLPEIGKVCKLPKAIDPNETKIITESYNLCDNVLPYSKGIHLVNCRMLCNNKPITVSGFYLADF